MDAADVPITSVAAGRLAWMTLYKDFGDEKRSYIAGTYCLGQNTKHDPVLVSDEDPWVCPECGARVESG